MTKTPEELTEDWKAGKLPADDYFIKLINNDITTGFFDGLDFSCCADFGIFQILAPVPTYDEYKAMQAAAQNGESAIDTNKRLCKKIEELKEQLAEHRENCCCLENEKLRLKLAEYEDSIADLNKKVEYMKKPNGNYPDRISKLKSRIKHLLGLQENQDEEIEILRDLLKECKEYIEFCCVPEGKTSIAEDLLTRINAALGDNKIQANPLDCNKIQESEE